MDDFGNWLEVHVLYWHSFDVYLWRERQQVSLAAYGGEGVD